MKDTIFKKCEKIIGPDNLDLTTDPPSLNPTEEKALCEVIRCIHSDKYKIRITGKSTYPVPDSDEKTVIISTKSLSVIKEVNVDDFLIITQSGVLVDDVAGTAEEFGLHLPLDIASGDISTIGGAFMTRAIGPSVSGYGLFEKSVTGVRCVNAQGKIVNFGGRTTKNVTGYDVVHFLSGTMGLYAMAVELTIKTNPLPESRLIVASRFSKAKESYLAVDEIFSNFKEISIFEVTASEGLRGEISIGVGFEGLTSIVRSNINLTSDIMGKAGAEDSAVEDYKEYMITRRNISRDMVGEGFCTISVPPASSGVFLKRISEISQEIPVIAHPKIGRFHLVCRDTECIKKLNESALAIGGKQAVEWEHIKRRGIASLFTKAELKIARSLKQETDPSGILNPHLRLI